MKTQDKADLKLSFSKQHDNWRMAEGMKPAQGPDKYPKVTVQPNHEGLITFKILNPNDVTFHATDPFRAKAGKQNPNDFGDQFAVVSGAGTQELVVSDANANKGGGEYNGGDYHYELHFSKGQPLDPIITNGGCCKSDMQANLAFYAIGGVALVAVIVLAYRMMTKRGPGPMKDSNQG